jgi:molecular chaperone DnaJ
VNEAYDALKDPDKKAAYDRFGHAAFEGAWAAGQARGWRGGGFGGRFRQRPFRMCSKTCSAISWAAVVRGGPRSRASRGSDLRYNLRITLEEAFAGAKKTIRVPHAVCLRRLQGHRVRGGRRTGHLPDLFGHGQGARAARVLHGRTHLPHLRRLGQIVKNPCKVCRGRGAGREGTQPVVNIPAGVETGTRIRLSGEGEAGLRGGPTGDLYIFIEVAEHPIFQRDGYGPCLPGARQHGQCRLGGEVEVPTIDGGRSA